MKTITITEIPSEITDFAFDQLPDYTQSPVEINYQERTVTVEDDKVETVTTVLAEKCNEKIRDMLYESKNGYAVPIKENKLYQLNGRVNNKIKTK